MEINIPEIVAEVSDAFMRYEKALATNDVDTIDNLFWNSPLTLRYGPNGTLIGHAAITTYGRDFAVANTESDRPQDNATGRQSQTWARMPDGWRIVSAHVSDEPKM